MLSFTYNDITYELAWKDTANLVKFAVSQNYALSNWTVEDIINNNGVVSLDDTHFTQEFFFNQLSISTGLNWTRCIEYIPKDSKKILSVGPGVSTFELLLGTYHCIDATVFLLDKSESTHALVGKSTLTDKNRYFSESNNHGFYNSWEVVTDAINTSKLDSSKYIFVDPNDKWESDLDVVISLFSWCWHYPFEVYAEKLLSSLKIGGTLILEIQNPPDLRDVPKQISELLGSDPSVILRKSTNIHSNIHNNHKRNIDEKGEFGGFYVWVRKK